MASWLDRFAQRLEDRPDGPRGGLTLSLTAGRGVEARRVERIVGPHLTRRLERGGVVGPIQPSASYELRATVSLEGDSVWIVGLLSGGDLPAPIAVTQDWLVDRELEALLGLRPARTGQGRWTMERLGTLPAGVLDLAMVDLDGDGGDDLVVLGVDGLRTFLWSALEGRPMLSGGAVPLPSAPWERTHAGWLAEDDDTLIVSTTAGHDLRFDPRELTLTPGVGGRVPLRQARDDSRQSYVLGSRAPHSSGLTNVGVTGAPSLVRDLVRWPGRDDVALWVTGDGVLGGVGQAGPASFEERRVGDRIVLADLDGAAGPELVTTAASLPGEPDRVTVFGIGSTLESTSVLFEGELSGSVVALDAGDLDFDGRGELLFVEDTGGAAVLWLIRRRS